MINHDDTAHQVTIKKYAVDRSQRFNYTEHNIHFALGIIPKSFDIPDINLEEYVSFSALSVEWWWDSEEQAFRRNLTKIPLRNCRETDKLYFSGYEKLSVDWLDASWNQMMCLDSPEDVSFYGAWND